MRYKISKELFENVMYVKLEILGVHNDLIRYRYDDINDSILINDFFFKCKEWALKQGICLMTGVEEHMPNSWTFVCFQSNRYRPDPQRRLKNPLIEHKVQTPTVHCRSEHQCLFDACQWILDNNGK